jgi:hypothetical protein
MTSYSRLQIGPRTTATVTHFLANAEYVGALKIALTEACFKQLVSKKHDHKVGILNGPQMQSPTAKRARATNSPKQEIASKKPKSDVVAESSLKADEAYTAQNFSQPWGAYKEVLVCSKKFISQLSVLEQTNSSLTQKINQQKLHMWTQDQVDEAVEEAVTQAEGQHAKKIEKLQKKHEEKIQKLKLKQSNVTVVASPSVHTSTIASIDPEKTRQNINSESILFMNSFGDNMSKILTAAKGTNSAPGTGALQILE